MSDKQYTDGLVDYVMFNLKGKHEYGTTIGTWEIRGKGIDSQHLKNAGMVEVVVGIGRGDEKAAMWNAIDLRDALHYEEMMEMMRELWQPVKGVNALESVRGDGGIALDTPAPLVRKFTYDPTKKYILALPESMSRSDTRRFTERWVELVKGETDTMIMPYQIKGIIEIDITTKT